ncbi:hypothetical protein [Amycolatopsis sp. CA-230715]|uniref:hypothetical protein n=1 Tax=Amycolatopsis sp. CA-230715 TaxID=2745196 RepID=UPI001C0329BC|nr:hypothetical protein [Amycolatopsis sp. CA-230715]QWF85707.1 hypothetical protein HUW46_09187 [Amycolatopsis sp. CA-230715]
MPNHISAEQLSEGTYVFIRGTLSYARLTSVIEGDELKAADQRRIQNNMNPIGKPHVTATITGAEVQYTDPANPTLEERFVAERCYRSRKKQDAGLSYSIDSKGSKLPPIAIPAKAGDGTYEQDNSRQELAQGLDVTLVLRVYKPQNYAKRGLALDQVIVHETPRYFNPSGVTDDELAAHGIVFASPPRAVQAPSDGSAVGPAEDIAGTEANDGLPLPAPQPSAAAAPASRSPQVEETLEEKLARVEAENTALKDAGSAVGAAVAVGAANDRPGTGHAGPGDQQPGITYQG